nr:hypothetical protein [Gordonia sp. HS-NH1]
MYRLGDRTGRAEFARFARFACGDERRDVDEVATDVADDEAAALGNRQAARVRTVCGIGIV